MLHSLLGPPERRVAVLYAMENSVYNDFESCDVYDARRNALTFPGGAPIVAHPPCRLWGRLAAQSKAPHSERWLAIHAVLMVWQYGGVVEHPANSKLWREMRLAPPGSVDVHGGFTFPIDQSCFGHRAQKPTWLYIVGLAPCELPAIPLKLGTASHVVNTRIRKGNIGWRPSIKKLERSATPPALAAWLVAVAQLTQKPRLEE